MTFPTAFIGDSDNINTIIETPKGSRNKYAFDTKTGLYKLTKTLPAGMAFPFEFGFIPGTKGADGDPLDVLVLMDEPSYPGCYVECRVIGVIEAEQKEGDDNIVRNDRIIAVCLQSYTYSSFSSLKDLNKKMLDEITSFFISYHSNDKKEFTPIKNGGRRSAIKLIRQNSKQ